MGSPSKPPKTKYEKHTLYEASVQASDDDVEFLDWVYKQERSKAPLTLKEDFCGTFWLCTEWVKSHSQRIAVGVDLSEDPTEYGFRHHHSTLSNEQKKRVEIFHRDVRATDEKKYDIVCALNFSYFIFKQREVLRGYFQAAYESTADNGLFVIDHFGGPENMNPQSEYKDVELDGKKFQYYWEQSTFNPITNEAMFHIHFKTPDKFKWDNAFVYDWRMWSVPELREIMLEAGFKETRVYWDFGGDTFEPTEVGEDDCDTWICYIVGIK